MKRIVLSSFLIVFVVILCFDRQVSAQSAINREEVKTLSATGTITLLIIGNFSKGLKSQISISSDYMGSMSFSVSEDTDIVGKDGEDFSSFLRGKSFDCKMTKRVAASPAGFWAIRRKMHIGREKRFRLGDYFSKSGGKNNNGLPVMGWGKGADRYGCEYVAYSQFAKASNTDKSKNLYTHVQIPTGDCYGSAANITTASDFSCANESLESGETTTEEPAIEETAIDCKEDADCWEKFNKRCRISLYL